MSDSSQGNLEQEALKRKERLSQLKRKLQEGDQKFVGRNYQTETEEAKTNNIDVDIVEKQVEEQISTMKRPLVIDEIDISNLAPRKVDWDLKRDLSKKLQILEKRTQKAIAELIRERIKGGHEDISQVVNVAFSENKQIEEEID